jgi:hypothetical protein
VVVGVHVEQLPAPPLVRYGLKLLPFRLDRLLGVLELVDLPQGRDLVADEAHSLPKVIRMTPLEGGTDALR